MIKRVTIQNNIAYHQGNSDKKTNNTIKIIYHQGNSDKKTNNTIKIIYHQGNSHKKGKIAKI